MGKDNAEMGGRRNFMGNLLSGNREGLSGGRIGIKILQKVSFQKILSDV